MSLERFEGGVWFVCECGQMLHRDNLYTELIACQCGNSTLLDDWNRQQQQSLSALFRQLNIDDLGAWDENWREF